MKQRNLFYKLLVIILTTVLFFISCDSSKSDQSVDIGNEKQSVSIPGLITIDTEKPETVGFRFPDWAGVLDERGFDPLDSIYPEGPVKKMKAWATETQGNNKEKELFIIKEYDSNGRISQKKTLNHGDESGWNYIYDDYGRLIIVEETFNGEIVPERKLTYKYLPFNSEENKVVREVFKNTALIRVDTELIVDNRISLEFDFTDKKTTVTNSIYFENGNIVKHVDVENFKYESKFLYDEHGIIIKTIEFNSKGIEMFIYDFKYNEDGILIEGITNDYRHNPPTIMRTEKAMNHDLYGNWLRKELYEDDIFVAYIERDILYY